MKKDAKLLLGEEYLISIDEELEKFSETYSMKLSKNYHDYPERSLEWKSKNMNKILQIYKGENKQEEYFYLWGAVFKDKFSRRYIWKTDPKQFHCPLDWNSIKKELLNIKEKMESLSISDLKDTTTALQKL